MHIAAQTVKMAEATYLGEVDPFSTQPMHACYIAWWAIKFVEGAFGRRQQFDMWSLLCRTILCQITLVSIVCRASLGSLQVYVDKVRYATCMATTAARLPTRTR